MHLEKNLRIVYAPLVVIYIYILMMRGCGDVVTFLVIRKVYYTV